MRSQSSKSEILFAFRIFTLPVIGLVLFLVFGITVKDVINGDAFAYTPAPETGDTSSSDAEQIRSSLGAIGTLSRLVD